MSVHITVTGHLALEPKPGSKSEPKPVNWVHLRVASNHADRAHGSFTSTPSTFWDVVAFGALAKNIASSLHTGDPIEVTGLLGTSSREGAKEPNLQIRATSVNVPLARATVVVTRTSAEGQDATDDQYDEADPPPVA